jgi:hypothetical protein
MDEPPPAQYIVERKGGHCDLKGGLKPPLPTRYHPRPSATNHRSDLVTDSPSLPMGTSPFATNPRKGKDGPGAVDPRPHCDGSLMSRLGTHGQHHEPASSLMSEVCALTHDSGRDLSDRQFCKHTNVQGILLDARCNISEVTAESCIAYVLRQRLRHHRANTRSKKIYKRTCLHNSHQPRVTSPGAD